MHRASIERWYPSVALRDLRRYPRMHHFAVKCCTIQGESMATKRRLSGGRSTRRKPRAIRASVSLPPEIYRTLEALAKQKRVSTAWVMRDAAEKYVAEQWPLFSNGQKAGLE
jgi:hypothetical protein